MPLFLKIVLYKYSVFNKSAVSLALKSNYNIYPAITCERETLLVLNIIFVISVFIVYLDIAMSHILS